eukprot:SAG31_NODE_4374_length_3297_cov_1.307067_4_plen_81_part_00
MPSDAAARAQLTERTDTGHAVSTRRMQELGSFSNMKQFWKIWGELDVKLPEHSNFWLFKQRIQPIREDPLNVNGGRILIR